MIRRGGTAPAGAPTYTYTGNSQLFDEGNGNWNIQFLTSGTFTSNQDASIQVFLFGGGGAGSQNGGAGGGGYSATSSGISMLRNVPYTINIGSGGATSGAAGSNTTAFGNTGNGGGGGIAGTITGQTCVVIGTSGAGGNVYYYSSLKAERGQHRQRSADGEPRLPDYGREPYQRHLPAQGRKRLLPLQHRILRRLYRYRRFGWRGRHRNVRLWRYQRHAVWRRGQRAQHRQRRREYGQRRRRL